MDQSTWAKQPIICCFFLKSLCESIMDALKYQQDSVVNYFGFNWVAEWIMCPLPMREVLGLTSGWVKPNPAHLDIHDTWFVVCDGFMVPAVWYCNMDSTIKPLWVRFLSKSVGTSPDMPSAQVGAISINYSSPVFSACYRKWLFFYVWKKLFPA